MFRRAPPTHAARRPARPSFVGHRPGFVPVGRLGGGRPRFPPTSPPESCVPPLIKLNPPCYVGRLCQHDLEPAVRPSLARQFPPLRSRRAVFVRRSVSSNCCVRLPAFRSLPIGPGAGVAGGGLGRPARLNAEQPSLSTIRRMPAQSLSNLIFLNHPYFLRHSSLCETWLELTLTYIGERIR